MCARYSLLVSGPELAELFDLDWADESEALYNVAPTDQAPVIVVSEERDGIGSMSMRFGLVPFWAKDLKIGVRMINARSETVADKPAFRAAFRRRRCLVPVSGFYEWQKQADGKQPLWIHSPHEAAWTLAGLWETWNKGAAPVHSFTILTRDSQGPLKQVHPRMPVFVPPQERHAWLGENSDAKIALSNLLSAAPEAVVLEPVTKAMSNPRNKSAEVVAPIGPPLDFPES